MFDFGIVRVNTKMEVSYEQNRTIEKSGSDYEFYRLYGLCDFFARVKL